MESISKHYISEYFIEPTYIDKIKAVLFGVAVGDALGVPVEFKRRGKMKLNPVTDMTGGSETTYIKRRQAPFRTTAH
ncbi:MAG: ADP-ribosylglycohydrolase family protein [Tannerella sp.]|nr:ADP-ribosylglycohydrolase family protein [Tannerella sp.]